MYLRFIILNLSTVFFIIFEGLMGNPKKQILVIDDEPENVFVLKERLEKANFEVLMAEDGVKGVELAASKLPDLIICDIMMPNMNGYDVMNHLRKNPKTATIPFIFLSAKSDPKDIREGMMIGADDYITKPFSGRELVAAIKTRLEKRELFEKNISDLRQSISYSLPHELQTPLTGIIGFTEILMEDYNVITPDQILEIAKNIKSSANRLNDLVQKILYSVKLDVILKDIDQIHVFRKEYTDRTVAIVTDTARTIAAEFKRVDDLVLELEDTALCISEFHFKKLLSELISNAFKYSKKGTTVNIVGTMAKTIYNFYVIDNGIGMTEEQISGVGEFTQYDRLNYERQGTGIGLAISKKLVELFGGEFEIESIPSQQTMVRFSLPVKEPLP